MSGAESVSERAEIRLDQSGAVSGRGRKNDGAGAGMERTAPSGNVAGCGITKICERGADFDAYDPLTCCG